MKTERTSSFLMANLGAEVSRIFSAKKHKDTEQIKICFKRANKILKKIISMPDMKKRKVEINILLELINDISNSKQVFSVSQKNLVSYFIPFASKIISFK